MGDTTVFGVWLKSRRKALDLRQEDLAELVGCAMMTIQKIEAGERRPSRQIAELLAARLNIPPDERPAFVHFARFGPRMNPAAHGSVEPAPWRKLRHILTNLPVQPAPLIGRAREIEAVSGLVLRERVRLVTLVGPPGIGKTSLSIHIAGELLDYFDDGVYFVTLAPVSDPQLVVAAIAETLGLKESGSQSLLEYLRAALRDKRRLLVLDNFEQLVDAAPVVADLLASCPWLKIVVTSRAVLHLRGERQFVVPPLALPALDRLPAVTSLADYAAVALFVERAQSIAATFALTEENARHVATICVRLDGLPLAIELAAARINLFTPQEIQARLILDAPQRLALLASPARDLPARQQTLRSAIAWSYDLLNSGEQLLFARLGVFVGGATLSAIEAVCNARGDLPMCVPDGVASLLDKSLLRRHADTADGAARFTMLETILEYARERLEARGETATARRLHAEFYLGMATAGAQELHGPQQGMWLDRLEQEHDNLRTILSWSQTEDGDAEIGLWLAAALGPFWEVRGYHTEGRSWLTSVLKHSSVLPQQDGTYPTKLLARNDASIAALAALARLAHRQGDYEFARAMYQASLAVAVAVEDQRGMAAALEGLGSVELYQRQDAAAARRFYEQALAKYRALGDQWGIANTLFSLVDVLDAEGDCHSVTLAEECLELFRALGDKGNIAMCLLVLSDDPRRQGDALFTRNSLIESLTLFKELNDKRHIGRCLGELAFLAWQQHQFERAAILFGAAEAIFMTIGASMHPEVGSRFDRSIADTRSQLGSDRFTAAWARGQALTAGEAVNLALDAAQSTVAVQPIHR
jgi:predicted ATPase/transcriptional regulator with XRE-family HTH domain